MKGISLIISGISSFRRNNPLVFSVYIIGYVLMCFVFIYTYTNFMPSVVDGADNRVDSRFYVFRTEEDGQPYDAEKLYDYLRDYKPLYCDLSVTVSTEEILGGEYEQKDMEIRTRLDSAFENCFMGGQVDEPAKINRALENNEKIIVLGEIFKYPDADLRIGDDDFMIVPADIKGGENSRATVSFDYFKKYFRPTRISMVVGETLRNGRHEEFLRVLESEYGFFSTYEPSEFLTTDYETNLHYSRQIVVIFGVAVCVFMLLIRFLLEYSKYEYTIYRLVGAKYDTITALVFSQVVLSNAIIVLISIGIYEIFYDAFFEKLNMYRDIHMKMTDYAFMTGVLIMFSAMTIVPFILFSIKNSVAKCINYYG